MGQCLNFPTIKKKKVIQSIRAYQGLRNCLVITDFQLSRMKSSENQLHKCEYIEYYKMHCSFPSEMGFCVA